MAILPRSLGEGKVEAEPYAFYDGDDRVAEEQCCHTPTVSQQVQELKQFKQAVHNIDRLQVDKAKIILYNFDSPGMWTP